MKRSIWQKLLEMSLESQKAGDCLISQTIRKPHSPALLFLVYKAHKMDWRPGRPTPDGEDLPSSSCRPDSEATASIELAPRKTELKIFKIHSFCGYSFNSYCFCARYPSLICGNKSKRSDWSNCPGLWAREEIQSLAMLPGSSYQSKLPFFPLKFS